MLGTLPVLLKSHDVGEAEQMGLGNERPLGSWLGRRCLGVPAKGDGPSLEFQQPFKWEEAEMGTKGQVSQWQ